MTRTTLTALALIGSFAGSAFGQFNVVGPGSTPKEISSAAKGPHSWAPGFFNYYTAASQLDQRRHDDAHQRVHLSFDQARSSRKTARRARRAAAWPITT